MTKEHNLATAYLKVAKINHFMVGVIEPATYEELSEAEQILIDGQNDVVEEDPEWEDYDLALNLIGLAMKEKRND